MKKKQIIFLMFLVGFVLLVPGPDDFDVLVGTKKPALRLVVDPGHGGLDGGAEGKDGTMEKDINLSIGKALQRKGEERGIFVTLTRETEDGLYAKENEEKTWKKLEDMNCRKEIVDEAKADAVISIHLNSFLPDSEVRGAQVFYPKNGRADIAESSCLLAENVQKSLIESLQDGSNRIQMGKDDFYLFKAAEEPTILVECGFLSNPQDLENLKQKKYQEQIAEAILDGVCKSLEI